jgi:hypothetical protein
VVMGYLKVLGAPDLGVNLKRLSVGLPLSPLPWAPWTPLCLLWGVGIRGLGLLIPKIDDTGFREQ